MTTSTKVAPLERIEQPPVVDHLLVGRLFRAYDSYWWYQSVFKGLRLQSLKAWPAVTEHMPEDQRSDPAKFKTKRIKAYDLGRVRYFVDRLQAGEELDPIMVDNVCDGGHIYPQPLVLDGHHRFVAYRLTKRPTIPAHYSGRVDLLEYLKGTRARRPV